MKTKETKKEIRKKLIKRKKKGKEKKVGQRERSINHSIEVKDNKNENRTKEKKGSKQTETQEQRKSKQIYRQKEGRKESSLRYKLFIWRLTKKKCYKEIKPMRKDNVQTYFAFPYFVKTFSTVFLDNQPKNLRYDLFFFIILGTCLEIRNSLE